MNIIKNENGDFSIKQIVNNKERTLLSLTFVNIPLQDVLQNDDHDIDWMFKFSFAVDIAKVWKISK